MRSLLLSILGLVLSAAVPASAQVTVDLHALQVLPEHHAAPEVLRRAPAPRTASPVPARREATRTESTRAETAKTANGPAGSGTVNTAKAEAPVLPTPPVQQPAVPQSAPQTATIEPITAPAPAANAPPPPPPPVSATAGTVASPTSEGLRLTFEPGKSDLTPESVEQIKKLTSNVKLGDTTTYNVAAYAPGSSDDPSTARRMSLSRAMAVRQALVADGVPSPRIFVRALGDQYGGGPADRVDIDVQGAAQAASK